MTLANLTLSWQQFVNYSYKELHNNPTMGSVADIKSKPERRLMEVISTQDIPVLTVKQR
jgi:hypothetical protein